MENQKSTRREALQRLAVAQKSSRGAAPYSRWVNRWLGRHLASFAYLVDLRPNQVSALSGLITFSALAVVATVKPSAIAAVCVVLLLLFGYALDSADGQLARLRGGGSIAGEWLDHVIDAIKANVFHLVVLISWWRYFHLRVEWLLVPLSFSVVASVFFFAMILSDMLRRLRRVTTGGSALTTSSVNPNEPAPLLRSLIVIGNDYGLLCVVMLLWGARNLFVIAYTALLVLNACYLALGLVRWFREMARLDAGLPTLK